MSRSKKIAAWVAANLVVLIGLPVAFAVWLSHEVSEEYRLGIRTSTDGDTWAIPVFGLFLWLLLLLVVSNALLVALWWGAGAAPVPELPNPLMQPTNAGDAGRRPRPALPAATRDRRFSQVVCS